MWKKASQGEIPEEKLWQAVETHTGKRQKELLDSLFSERKPNIPLLNFLNKNKDKYKLGIINNGLYKMLEKATKEWKLNEIFDVILNSAQEKISKPNPEIFLLAFERLKVKPKECLFIDDKEKYVIATRNLGAKGLVYTSFEQFRRELNKLEKIKE